MSQKILTYSFLTLLCALSPLHAEKQVSTPVRSYKISYEYKLDGRVMSRAVGGVKQIFEYDLINQLIGVKDASIQYLEHYLYDAAGNMIRKQIGDKVTNYLYVAAGRMVAEDSRSYQYDYLNKVMQVRDGGELIASMSYHSNGQLADVERPEGEKESFLWDGLALIKRNETSYINEPAATGGNPVLSGSSAMLNDTLGSTYAIEGEGGLIPIERTQFGTTETQQDEFFTGKPHITELGYVFMYRNYRHKL